MTFATRTVAIKPGMFAVSSIGVPFVTGVDMASEKVPYLGIGLSLDPAVIAPMMQDMADENELDAPAVDVGWADADLLRPMKRLLAVCSQAEDAAVLAPLAITEIHYRLLKGDVGNTVRQLVASSRRSVQIRKVAAYLRQTQQPAPAIAELAAMVGMSVTSLHRHFKIATGHSPIEYSKHLRLIAAKSLLTAGAMSVTETASHAGYISPSQFSREYKRKFGVSPRDHIP